MDKLVLNLNEVMIQFMDMQISDTARIKVYDVHVVSKPTILSYINSPTLIVVVMINHSQSPPFTKLS